MDSYQIGALGSLRPQDMDAIQKQKDEQACEVLEQYRDVLVQILGKSGFLRLKKLFTNTMKKQGYIYNGLRQAFGQRQPEGIYNLNLETGEIETNKNGKRVRYRTAVIAPCTTTAVRYVHGVCGQVDIVHPPMKSPQRTVEKIIQERLKEHDKLVADSMSTLSQIDEKEDIVEGAEKISLLNNHFPTFEEVIQTASNDQAVSGTENRVKNAFQRIVKDDLIPKDIFRLSVLVKFPEHIGKVIRDLEDHFPHYISFIERNDNQYEKTISQNPRFYFDRKKTACIIDPETGEKFFVEFQFKQKNMFYAHMRSHKAYEDYRKALACYEKSQSPSDKKRCDEARKRCLEIHRNAVHQSNLYLLSEIAWADDNERTYNPPLTSNGQYLESQEMIDRNYIVEDYDRPFDGVTAFSTSANEHLNKAFYLKLIGILPENFDELGKYAKVHINKSWQELTDADLNNFHAITEAAIRYQEFIRDKQRREKERDDGLKNSRIRSASLQFSIGSERR